MYELMGSKGLGDALYVRAIALHLIARGEAVTVFTLWPQAFADIPVTLKTLALTGKEDIRNCVYCLHCRLPEVEPVDIFTQCCRQAGIAEPVALKMDWRVKNPDLVAKIKRRADGRKVFIYQPPKLAKGAEQALLRPRREAFIEYLEQHRDCYRIKLGHPASVEEFAEAPCELNLFKKASIFDAFDIASIGDHFFSDPSYLIILAEATDKRFTCMFSSRSAGSNIARVRNLTPQKIFHKPHLGLGLYDE